MENSERQSENEAILKLLSDDDPQVVHLVLEQLRSKGSEGIRKLDSLHGLATGNVRRVLQDTLRELRSDPALKARCHQITTLAELEDFCWRLCLKRNPETNVEASQAVLQNCAETVLERIRPGTSDLQKLEILISVLAREEGFVGNMEKYYDPENSFLDQVIASRQGLPITLTMIYMLVAARAGLHVDGIGMPGHFIARLGKHYFDPFNAGRLLSRQELVEALRNSGLPDPDHLLEPISYRMIAHRMVMNIVNYYDRIEPSEDSDQWKQVLMWLQEES